MNKTAHTCPTVNRRKRLKSAKSRWVGDAVKNWVLEDSEIGVRQLQKNLKKKYGLEVPYMRVFYGKQMALDNIYGKCTDSFQLLYTFKAEVDTTKKDTSVTFWAERIFFLSYI